jgi:hypothetical protein
MFDLKKENRLTEVIPFSGLLDESKAEKPTHYLRFRDNLGGGNPAFDHQRVARQAKRRPS